MKKRAAKKTKHKPLWVLLFVLLFLILAGIFCFFSFQFELNGSDRMILAYGEEYREKGAKATFFGKDVSSLIQKKGSVDDKMLGCYELNYSVQGLDFLFSQNRIVEIKDISIPNLHLAGGLSYTVALDSEFSEPGYQAIDNHDGDITANVKVTGEVDTSKPDEYELLYEVTDQSGNSAKAIRKVIVTRSSPLTMSIEEFTLNGYFTDVILTETEDAGEEYINDTIFIGDSITENGMIFGFYPRKNIWAKHGLQPDTMMDTPVTLYRASETGRDLELTIIEAAGQFQPERVIINIGSNSAYWMSPETYAQYYEQLLTEFKRVSPETEIIISSIYPVDARYDNTTRFKSSTSNDKCNKINFALAQMCRKIGVKFLNVAEVLKDENGQAIPDSVYESDGIHPKKEMYPLIVDYIRTHAYLQ